MTDHLETRRYPVVDGQADYPHRRLTQRPDGGWDIQASADGVAWHPVVVEPLSPAVVRRLVTERDEVIDRLRAVLTPLLDNPWRARENPNCLFCNALFAFDHDEERETSVHTLGCPVSQRDELLGRP
jgi:hypothetical protein